LLVFRTDKQNMKRISLILIIGLIAAILLIACDGETTRPVGGKTYRVEAVLHKELLTGGAQLDLTLLRNGSYYKGADITLNGMEIDTCVCGYCRTFGAAQIFADSSYVLNIRDSAYLDIDLTLSLPGELSINSPAVRHYTGDPVSVEWSISQGNDGYILATRPPDSAITDDGYEAYVSGTGETIPPETFVLNISDRILGTHNIYVVSYIGAPVDFPSLPFDIPTANNPADNVNSAKIDGRIAGMVIAAPDSIIVSEL
jgi:hypothetical protein